MAKTVQQFINQLKAKYPDCKWTTTTDVQLVLKTIGEPGKSQEVKRKVVSQLFTSRSPQGYKTEDSLESYEEF